MPNPSSRPNKSLSTSFIQKTSARKKQQPKVDTLIQLIHYQSKAEALTPPLHTARAQQEANQRAAAVRLQKKAFGKGQQKRLSPLVQHQLTSYQELIDYLLRNTTNATDKKKLKEMLNFLLQKEKSGSLSTKDLEKLSYMLTTLNQMANGLKGKTEQQYWAKTAMMFQVMIKLTNQLLKDPKNSQYKKLLDQLKEKAELNKGMAAARADGNTSLADLFRQAILDHYMPGQEKMLAELAALLKFSNEGATAMNDLLSILSDLSNASSDFDLSSLLHGGSGGNYPGGQNIQNQINNEKSAVQRDSKELQKASQKIDQQLKQLEEEQKGEKNPKIAKLRQKLIDQLKGEKEEIGKAQQNLQQLGKLLSQLKVTVHSDGTASISGPKGWQSALARDENGVINGSGSPPSGGLQQIYQELSGDEKDYGNQSQTQQMQLQLMMTEIEQEWTAVSTCMTTLNQAMMTVAQGIYK